MFSVSKYICSKGFIECCDIRPNQPISSISRIFNYNLPTVNYSFPSIGKPIKYSFSIFPPPPPSRIISIYVCNSALMDFIQNYLHQINYVFVLVSGDSDNTIFINNEFILKLINSEKLKHWFCQNCIINHPKITKLPIGLDYHTIYFNRNHSWGETSSPLIQEKELIEIQSKMPLLNTRKCMCYCNFKNINYGAVFSKDRISALNEIPSELLFIDEFKPRKQSWEKQTEFAFVVSPHGNGLDCHRTWEAFLLGCIVIVKSSDIDSLYYGLPVIIVKEWKDITAELLESKLLIYNDCWMRDYYLMNYWKQKFVLDGRWI